MDDLIGYFLTLAVLFIGTQLFCFFIDLIAWAVRKKHPAKIEKSEDVSYPEFLGCSFIVFFMFLHRFLVGPDTLARMELKKYLKAQDK